EAQDLRSSRLLPSFARLGRARAPVAPLAWVVHYYVIAIALRWKISVHNLLLQPSRRYHIFFQLLLDWTVLLFHQARVIFLRRRLQFPLGLEQGRVVDVIENLPEIVILHRSHAPEWRLWNIRRIRHHCAALREHRADFFIHRRRFRIFLHCPAVLQTRLALAVLGRQILHHVQARERVFSVE